MKADGKQELKCWVSRLWWSGLIIGIILAYFVLRNFEMGYWFFLFLLVAFAALFSMAGRYLGDWIDKNHRSDKSLLRQEQKQTKAVLKWLKRIDKKHGQTIETESVKKKLTEHIERLTQACESEDTTWEQLAAELEKVDKFSADNLVDYKKSPVREYVESIGFAVLIALALRAFVIEAFQIPSGSMIPSLRVGDHIFVNKLSYGIRIPLLPLKIGSARIPAVSWNWSMPDPGDVIVFITPQNEEEDYIKRVVAVGGDTVTVKDGVVYVNGKPYEVVDEGLFLYNKLDEDRQFENKISTRRYTENIGEIQHPILRKSCQSSSECFLFGSAPCDFEKKICQQVDFKPYVVPEDHLFVMGDNRDNSQDSRFWGSVPIEFVKGRAIFIWWSYRENLVRWDRMFTRIP